MAAISWDAWAAEMNRRDAERSRQIDDLTKRVTALETNAKLDEVLRLLTKQGVAMSALSDKIAEVGTSVDAALSRVQEDVDALNAQIADLTAKVAQNPTPEDMAALDALKAKVDALDPVKPATLPTP